MTALPRALVVTDSDSYVKWGAALAGQLPKDWPVRLVVARSNAQPSARQIAVALEETRFAPEDVELVDREALAEVLRTWRPDVVVAAARGYTVQSTVALIPNERDRPVIVSGLAGIAVPVLPFGLGFRRSVDVFVVHSRRELREFAAASVRLGVPHDYRLATLPFLQTAPTSGRGDAARSPRRDVARDALVFAAQAVVPASRSERAHLLARLVDVARAHPERRVVIKVRALAGETQTHREIVPFEDLLAERVAAGAAVPGNLVIEDGSMAEHLATAAGFLTVSSTAILEALAADVPVLAIDDFGIGADQINEVLRHSGLIGSLDDVVAGEFRRAADHWLEDNYFHDPADDSWVPRVEVLLDLRRVHGLNPYREVPAGWLNRLRAVFYRHAAFTSVPGSRREKGERAFLAVALWANRRRWSAVTLWRRLRT